VRNSRCRLAIPVFKGRERKTSLRLPSSRLVELALRDPTSTMTGIALVEQKVASWSAAT